MLPSVLRQPAGPMPTVALNDRSLAGLTPGAARRVDGGLPRLTIRDPETDVSTHPTLTPARARDLARAALRASSVGLCLEQHARRKKRSGRGGESGRAALGRRRPRGWVVDDSRRAREEQAAPSRAPVGAGGEGPSGPAGSRPEGHRGRLCRDPGDASAAQGPRGPASRQGPAARLPAHGG
jgi:hypothetical protein